MLRHLDELPDDASIEGDVVVIGAGAAGISIALTLAPSRRVLLLEAGGLELDGETQDLYDGSIVGLPYDPLQSSRARCLGGTTELWTGWCKPLDAADFEPRPEIGCDGWPITLNDLMPWYQRAQVLCEVGPYRYDDRLWVDAGLDPAEGSRLRRCYWTRSPPTRFGQRYREELRASRSIDVLLGANVLDIATDADAAHVTALDCRSLSGRRVRVSGKTFVLAAGGIENARLLLASNRVQREGLGNGRDVVGRYFMEHPHWELATILTSNPYRLVDRYYRQIIEDRVRRIGWSLTPEAQLAAGCRNASAEIEVDTDDAPARTAASVGHLVLAGEMPDGMTQRTLQVLSDLDEIAVGAWRKWVLGRYVNKPISRLELMVTIDPQPNPDSRVTLTEQRDALGMPRVALDWRLSDIDAHSAAVLTRTVTIELTRLGYGRARLHGALEDASGAWIHAGNLVGHDVAPGAPEMSISWHNMGTTRMSSDPSRGVVDADCKVHGIDNLFIAGSSVFPSTGNANPTLTIVALAVRLAAHLAGQRQA